MKHVRMFRYRRNIAAIRFFIFILTTLIHTPESSYAITISGRWESNVGFVSIEINLSLYIFLYTFFKLFEFFVVQFLNNCFFFLYVS